MIWASSWGYKPKVETWERLVGLLLQQAHFKWASELRFLQAQSSSAITSTQLFTFSASSISAAISKLNKYGIWSSKNLNSTPIKNPNIPHLHFDLLHYDAVSFHFHFLTPKFGAPIRFRWPSPMVSDPQPFPQLDRHSVPEETAQPKVSSQKSHHENPRFILTHFT